jgi:hypothetical protein
MTFQARAAVQEIYAVRLGVVPDDRERIELLDLYATDYVPRLTGRPG